MDALLVCAEEIALDGLDGCPITHLWSNLEKASPPFPLKLDDAAKTYLWRGIVEALDVSFYLLDEPLPRIFSNNEEKNLKDYLNGCKPMNVSSIDLAVNPYKLINDGKIRGSCSEYDTRKNITSEIRSMEGQCLVHHDEAYERWGDRFVMVASQNFRNKALRTEELDPNIVLNDTEYSILEQLGQARSKGRLQCCINMTLKLDARTTFHFLEKMKKLGIITKQKFVAQNRPSKNIWSNIVKLKRFHTPCYHKYDLLAYQLCQKLQDQPEHIILLKDLKKFFEESGEKGRIIKRVRQDLQTSGHVEIVMKRVSSEATTNKTRTSKGNLRYFVKLIKSYPLTATKQDVKDEVDDDDVEEDDGDDEDNLHMSEAPPNVVVEVSLLKQVYDFIESKAEHGTSNKDIDNAIHLSHYERRALVKTLEKAGHVKEFLTFGGRQSLMRYVATPFVDTSSHISKFREEEKKMDALKSVAGTFSPTIGTPVQTPTVSPCSSPAPSTQSTEILSEQSLDTEVKDANTEKKKQKGKVRQKSALAGKVTYRALKRKNFIVEYLKEKKITKGFLLILKALQEAEEKEGLESRVDRVFLKKSIHNLVEYGLIKKMTTLIEINDTHHNIDFYLHQSVDFQDQVVKVAIDQCRFQLYGEANKSKKRKKETDKLPQGEEEDEDKDYDPDKIISNHKLRYNYGYLGKFPRMRLFHEYLWQLIFGIKLRKQDTRTLNEPDQSGSDQSGSTRTDRPYTRKPRKSGTMDSGSLDSGVEKPELSTGEFDSKTHDYGWIDYLEPFPLYDMPLGWFKLVDAISIMPLSVFCNIIGIVTEIDDLDKYYHDPKLRHMLLKDLPDNMQRLLKHKGRYKQSLSCIVSNLLCAGLLSPKLPLPTERMMTELHFNRGAILTDTTISLPNSNQTKEPDNRTFSSKKFVFNSFSEVQAYWEKTMCIGLNTPLGVIRAAACSRERKWYKFSYSKAPVMLEDSIAPPPGDGKGACGFDSFLHAHLTKNWSFYKSGHPHYGASKIEKRAVDSQNGEPLAKKQKKNNESSKKAKSKESKKADKPKPKPKQKAKRSSFEDFIFRPPKIPRTTGPPIIRARCFSDKEKQKSTQSVSNHLISVDDVDRAAIAKAAGLRKKYSPEIDKTLILCRIGLEIMKKTSYRNPYPFQHIRDILHQHCEDSLDKTAPNCQKRLLRLMKNPVNVTAINVCVAEYSAYEEFNGMDNPELPFPETFSFLVTRLIERSRTRVSCMENTSQLCSSLDELYQRFYVQRLALPGEEVSPFSDTAVLGPAIQNVKDIRVSVARDIIQISCHSEQVKYNSLGVFKLFEDLKFEEKDEAFSELQRTGLINRKRDFSNTTTTFRRKIPFAPLSSQLSHIYYKHFHPNGVQPIRFDEAIIFLEQLRGSSDSTQAHPKPIKLSEENIVGGEVATILSLLPINKVTVEFHVPDQIVHQDEKQPDNFSTKKKSKLTSATSKSASLKQLPLKQKKGAKKSGRTKGKVGINAKGKVTRKTANKMTDSGEDSTNSKSTHRDDSTGDEARLTKTKRKRITESEHNDGKCKPARKIDLTGEEVKTAKTAEKEGEPSGTGKDGDQVRSARKRSSAKERTKNDSDLITSSEDEFMRPKRVAKETNDAQDSMVLGKSNSADERTKNDSDLITSSEDEFKRSKRDAKETNDAQDSTVLGENNSEDEITKNKSEDELVEPKKVAKETNKKDDAQESILLGQETSGVKTSLAEIHIPSTALERKESTQQEMEEKGRSRGKPEDDQLKNTEEGNTDEALEDPFLDNQSLLHCKFSSTRAALLSMNHDLFTPIYCADTPTLLLSGKKDNANLMESLKRKGRMKGKGLTQPMLLTNSNEIILINNCSIFVRPKVAIGIHGNVCDIDSDVSMEIKESAKSLEILSPRSLDAILKDMPSFDAYLDACTSNEGFDTSKIQLCTLIWEAANEMKELGTTMTLLKQIMNKKTSLLDQASCSLERHLKNLCHANQVLQVGTFEKRYVCPRFARSWCINFMKSTNERNEENSLLADDILAVSPSESLAVVSMTIEDSSVMKEATLTAKSSTKETISEPLTVKPVAPEATALTSTQTVTTSSNTVQTLMTEPMTRQPMAPATTSYSAIQTITSSTAIPTITSSNTVQALTPEPMTRQPMAPATISSTAMQTITSLTAIPTITSSNTVQALMTESVTGQLGVPAATTSNTIQTITSSNTVRAIKTEPGTGQPVAPAETSSNTIQTITSSNTVRAIKTEPVTGQLVTPAATSSNTVQTITSSNTVQASKTEPLTSQPIAPAATSYNTVQTISSSNTVQALKTEPVTSQPIAPAATSSNTVQTISSSNTVQTISSSNTVQALMTELVTGPAVAPAATSSNNVQALMTEPLSTSQPMTPAETCSTTIQTITSSNTVQVLMTEPVTGQPKATVLTESSLDTSTHLTACNLTEEALSSGTGMATDTKLQEIKQFTNLSGILQGSCEKNTDESSKKTSETLTRESDESVAIISRPWLELYGELNKPFLKSVLPSVLSQIMSNPGITEVHIAQKFSTIIRPVCFIDLLEYLESIGCITKHKLSFTKPTSLFSNTTRKPDVKDVIYYLPVVDCIVILANVIKNCF